MTGKVARSKPGSLTELMEGDFSKPPFQAGKWLPSERELSEKYGVSRPTLRKALATLERKGCLQSVPGKGHRLLAAPAGKSPAGVISVFLAELVNPFYAALASALSARFADRDVAIYDFAGDAASLAWRIARLRERESGPILVHFPGTREALEALGHHCAPPLILMHPFADLASALPYDQILLDSFGGGLQAVSHLLAMGRRNIAYVGLEGQAPERLRGARAALKRFGRDDGALHLLTLGLPGYTGAFETVSRAVPSPFPFDALFCANDDVALGALAALEARGLAVPGDVMVLGFDDIPAARMAHPTLSTIRQPMQQLAGLAADLVHAQEHSGSPEARVLTLPGELIVRESTGAPSTRFLIPHPSPTPEPT